MHYRLWKGKAKKTLDRVATSGAPRATSIPAVYKTTYRVGADIRAPGHRPVRPQPPSSMFQDSNSPISSRRRYATMDRGTFLDPASPLHNPEHEHLAHAKSGFLWTVVENSARAAAHRPVRRGESVKAPWANGPAPGRDAGQAVVRLRPGFHHPLDAEYWPGIAGCRVHGARRARALSRCARDGCFRRSEVQQVNRTPCLHHPRT